MKTFFKKSLLLPALIILIICLVAILELPENFGKKNPEGANLIHAQDTKVASELPLRLKIPGLDVDAAIESVGLTPKGAMGVPMSPDDVAWFNRGPRPGQTGSSVLAGHLDGIHGEAAVFSNLNKLRRGDQVQVTDDHGKLMSFVVTDSRLYDFNADASSVFESTSGTHLNLVTCAGTWDKSKTSYTKRLVVFTDLVN